MILDSREMKRLARLGAQSRLQELDREKTAILRAFPELRRRRAAANGADQAGPSRRRRRRMSAAQRRAVAKRMRKYWAERRKARARA